MTKPELGTKRLCASCGARFYDLLHSPITCPKCGTVLATADVSSSRVRVKATRESEREFERPVTETFGAPFASPKDADGEADGERVAGVLPEGEDDDELADEVMLPPAPVRFSTMNCCPSRSERNCPIKRA
jgi:uncharacterized protein (TIGR02300 family)